MQCPKCSRQISSKTKRCIYCGASINGQSLSKTDHNVGKDGPMIVSDIHYETDTYQDLPEQVRSRVDDALRKGDEGVIIEEESTIVQVLSGSNKEAPAMTSLEKILKLLSKMKNTLEGGNIGHREYNRMVFDIIKDHISTLPEDMRINFIVNEIGNSELIGFKA